jgi:hypothetical protein
VLGEASREVRRRPASSELVPPDPDAAAGAQDGALARTTARSTPEGGRLRWDGGGGVVPGKEEGGGERVEH